MVPGLLKGSMVGYVLADHDPGVSKEDVGKVCAAVVTNVWAHLHRSDGYVNLTVFPDWGNDRHTALTSGSQGLFWATSRTYSEQHEPGTWHWIGPDDGMPAAAEVKEAADGAV